MKHLLALLTIAALLAHVAPTQAAAQQAPRGRAMDRTAQRPLPPAVVARRDTLEARVIRRFVQRAGSEMALDAEKQRRLDETLQGTADRRRAVNLRSMELHRRINQAVKRPNTTQAVFSQLLAQQRALRQENQRIVDEEQTALAQFLTPREQAHFLTLWVRLQQDARQIQAQQPDGGLER